jgi:DNA-binding XRE family transcriptional regulator
VTHATYRWTTERDPTTGMNRVRRVQGPDPRAVLASSVEATPLPPPEEPPLFYVGPYLTTNPRWEGPLEKNTTAPTSEQIIAWRKEQGLSQAALARLANVSRAAVSAAETRTRIAKAARRKLGLALGKTEADW